jgi:hypothetical protein
VTRVDEAKARRVKKQGAVGVAVENWDGGVVEEDRLEGAGQLLQKFVDLVGKGELLNANDVRRVPTENVAELGQPFLPARVVRRGDFAKAGESVYMFINMYTYIYIYI